MRILVVEDDRAQRDLLRRILEDAGFAVEAVGDVDEALAIPGAFDVMLLDWSLPGGKTALDVVAAKPDVPRVGISGYDQPREWIGPWLRKPILSPATTLPELVRRVVATWRP